MSSEEGERYKECVKERLTVSSNSRVPFVALVFPIPSFAAGDGLEALDELDPHDVFSVLVAELSLDPQTDRRAVRHREGFIVQLVGEDGLGMIGVIKVNAFIIGVSVFVRVSAVKDHVPCGGEGLGQREELAEGRALPLADGTPSLHTVMTRDLRACGKRAQLRQRETGGQLDQP